MDAAMQKNAPDSATTFGTEPKAYENLSEAEFLNHQAELAKTAISASLDELKSALKSAADVKLWAHHHPWVSVGVAAATGFTLASMVGGSKSPDRSAHNNVGRSTVDRLNQVGAEDTSSASGSLLSSLFTLARTALEASLVAAIRTEGMNRAADAQAPIPERTAETAASESNLNLANCAYNLQTTSGGQPPN
jgi:hypothetical protein